MPNVKLHDIFCYPLKSGAALSCGNALVQMDGLLLDRRFVAVDPAGVCLTARTVPSLLSIRAAFEGQRVVLTATGHAPFAISLRSIDDGTVLSTLLWGVPVNLKIMDDAEEWLSAVLRQPARLGAQSERDHSLSKASTNEASMNLSDTAPVHLMNMASHDALNARLQIPTTMNSFRPNLVVSGAEAFAEDGWERVRIGPVEFEVLGPCARCVMTTINPNTGARNEVGEPMASLARLRMGNNRDVDMGVLLAPLSTGRISQGDMIEVMARRTARKYVLPGGTKDAVGFGIIRDKPVRVSHVLDEAPDVKTFALTPEDGLPLRYLAGQYVSLQLMQAGRAVSRSFTLSSSPTRPRDVQVTIARQAAGGATDWMHSAVQAGAELSLSGPFGDMHLDPNDGNEPLLLISAGAGITPMISILRDLADRGLLAERDIVFHHSARTDADRMFVDELRAIQRRAAGFLEVSWSVSSDAPNDSSVFSGRLTPDRLRAICPDIEKRRIYCCGSSGFMDLVRETCHETVRQGRWHEESFEASAVTAEASGGPFEVTFSRSGKTISGTGPRTLLSIAREAGVDIESECQSGICGRCRAKISDGEWTLSSGCADPSRSALSADEKDANVVLTCTSLPQGRVMVDL